MKKVTKEELVNILKNKSNKTYDTISELTGYHPKYLIQLNNKLKKNDYLYIKAKRKPNNMIDAEIKEDIKCQYLNSEHKSYMDFYNVITQKYDVSYSFLCKLLSDITIMDNILLVAKVKKPGDVYFVAVDYQTNFLLGKFKSQKRDDKSFKSLFYHILINFGSPKKICFVNFFDNIPSTVMNLLGKYDIEHIKYKSIFRNAIKRVVGTRDLPKVRYREVVIDREDFYDFATRKLIGDNLIQFDNIRYVIKSEKILKRGATVKLFYSKNKEDMFVRCKGHIFYIDELYSVESKRGVTKYY